MAGRVEGRAHPPGLEALHGDVGHPLSRDFEGAQAPPLVGQQPGSLDVEPAGGPAPEAQRPAVIGGGHQDDLLGAAAERTRHLGVHGARPQLEGAGRA